VTSIESDWEDTNMISSTESREVPLLVTIPKSSKGLDNVNNLGRDSSLAKD